MRLLRAEWSRLFARRLTTIMVVVLVALLGLIALGVGVDSHQPSAEVSARAAQLAERERGFVREQRAACEAAQAGGGTEAGDVGGGDVGGGDVGGGDVAGRFPPGTDCARDFDERRIRDEDFVPSSFNFASEAPEYTLVFGGILVMVAYAVGASFIGAEWSSGSLMNLLTWRPRRVGVLLTKLAALLTGLLAVGTVLAAAWIGVLLAIAQWRGTRGHSTTGSMLSLGLDNVRVLALALAAGAVGFSLASLGRRTAAALGVAIGWFLTMEIGLRLVLYSVEVPKVERWFLSTYVQAWLSKGAEFFDSSHCDYSLDEGCRSVQWRVEMGEGALVLGIVVAVLLVAAVAAMRRRDVT